MGKRIIKIEESQLREMIEESIRKTLNEIGETSKGQKRLGRLVKRLSDVGDYKRAVEIHDYAKEKRDAAYKGDNSTSTEKAMRKGNQMASAFLQGRGE